MLSLTRRVAAALASTLAATVALSCNPAIAASPYKAEAEEFCMVTARVAYSTAVARRANGVPGLPELLDMVRLQMSRELAGIFTTRQQEALLRAVKFGYISDHLTPEQVGNTQLAGCRTLQV